MTLPCHFGTSEKTKSHFKKVVIRVQIPVVAPKPFSFVKEKSFREREKNIVLGNIMFTEKIYSDWMKENQMNKYNEMKGFLPVIKGKVLDVGIGPGWFEDFFGIKSMGIDVDKDSCANVIASGDFIPFRDNSFDFVVCLDTIHLLTGKDVLRVLKGKGFFLVSHFVNKENEKEVEKRLLNMFNEFKLLKREIVGDKEKDLVMILQKVN